MSNYEVTVQNFIHLLRTPSSLFSEEDRAELNQLINAVSDDITIIASSISDWCEEHPEVDDALGELEKDVTQRGPGTEKANPNIPEYQTDKKTLLNAIQQSSYLPKKDEQKNGNS
ncbi:MAG: hypothetical protein ACFKPT_12240 [Gloeotrichia echinulata GP01]